MTVFASLFKESPRWLLSKGRPADAYRIVFGRPPPHVDAATDQQLANHSDPKTTAAPANGGGAFREIRGLYGNARTARIAAICHFAFFTASFSYYVTGEWAASTREQHPP